MASEMPAPPAQALARVLLDRHTAWAGCVTHPGLDSGSGARVRAPARGEQQAPAALVPPSTVLGTALPGQQLAWVTAASGPRTSGALVPRHGGGRGRGDKALWIPGRKSRSAWAAASGARPGALEAASVLGA